MLYRNTFLKKCWRVLIHMGVGYPGHCSRLIFRLNVCGSGVKQRDLQTMAGRRRNHTNKIRFTILRQEPGILRSWSVGMHRHKQDIRKT